jgi:hypothetical protein
MYKIPKEALPDKPSWDDEPLNLGDIRKLEIFAKENVLEHLKPLVFAKVANYYLY